MTDCSPPDTPPTYWITQSNGRIPVRRYGEGPQLVIALHGFTYQGNVFQNWATELGENYTVCAPDLPFHGAAEWQKKQVTAEETLALISAIAKKENQVKFWLLGHSMGARFIVCLAHHLAHQLLGTILLAPAGIGSYDRVPSLAVQRVAEAALTWPGWFKWLVLLGHKVGLISNFHRRYAEVQLFPTQSRWQLFRVFNALRYFATSTPKRQAFWTKTSLPTYVLLGKKDRLIPAEKVADYFANTQNLTLAYTNDGHELVTAASARLVAQWLTNGY
ncbi:MAG: alpha/beta hydrolase [Bacteroidota bacterium]